MIKVVIDNNVTFAALLFESKNCNKILKKVINKKITNHTSIEILKEFEEKLSNKFNVELNKIQEILTFILSISKLATIKENINIVRDHKDNIIIETACCSGVDYIITGDKDLLVLNKYKSIKIVTPKEFLGLLK